MISDVDETLRELMLTYGNLDPTEIDISFEKPDRQWAAGVSKPTVNLYLYEITENTDLKNPGAWVVRKGPDNTAIKSKPDVRIDLSYNVTVFASSIDDEHRLLSRVLVTLLKYPTLPAGSLQGLLVGQDLMTSTAHPGDAQQSPSDYWGAVDNDLKASLEYRITIRLDVGEEITTGVVLNSQFKVGQRGLARDELEAQPINIGGRVHDRDDASIGVENALVTVLERGLDTKSGKDGRYSIPRMLPGLYTLIIVVEGYEESRIPILVPSRNYDIAI